MHPTPPPTTYHLPPTTYRPPLTTYHLPPTAHHSSPTHHSTTHHPPERNANINVPTLVLRGEFDTMSEECHNAVVDSIPTAWPLVTVPRAAHCKFLDEPQLCVDAVQKFLNTCDLTRRA